MGFLLVAAAGALASDTLGTEAVPPPVQPFDFVAVQRLAKELAAQPYKDHSPPLPERLSKLSYDAYREIRFRAANALWRNLSLFEVQFFHRGLYFQRRVNLNEVADGIVRPIPYSSTLFDFGRTTIRPATLPPSIGFAGFRVHFPLHTPAYKDELIVFLGASYFKLLGRYQGYGASARGLAIDTAGTNGEEFPEFTDFWLVRPEAQAQELTIYALLDSRSVAGAYKFIVRPGTISQAEVSGVLYPRRSIDKVGIAPLTSMFLYGENASGRRFEDFRPEVHDSDGLTALTGRGEPLWRPLVNPRALRISRFLDENPQGFGLGQRDREFDHYQDNESRYERRPSYWVQPLGRWGKGSVELVEIPTEEEINDNIVAYWVPEAPVQANKPVAFSYLLSTGVPPHSTARAVATRIGKLPKTGNKQDTPDAMRRMVVDFAGGDLEFLDKSQPVQAKVSGRGGEVSDITVERLAAGNVWRAAFRILPKGGDPVDLRCNLTLYDKPLTETWLYLWTP